MNFFEQSRYRINKLLLGLVGLWPYQKKRESRFFLTMTLFWTLSLVSAQIRKVIIDRDNPQIIIEAVAPFIVDCVCTIKVLNSIMNSSKMCKMLKRIQDDVTAPMGPEEKILMQCIDDGRTFSLAYAVWMYASMTFFLILPVAPKIIVACGFANISAPAQFPFPVDYSVDPEENYVYLQMHLCVGVFLIISLIIAVDGMFVVFVQHACGIFSAIGYRLEHLAEDGDLNFELHPNRSVDETFWILIDCIKKHNEAIQFAELVNAAYSWSFLFSVGLNMAILSFSGFQIAVNLANGDLDEVFRQAVFSIGQMLHLFFESYFSQRLTDHSLRVHEALNGIKWYKTSMRTRKLLNFMVLRSTVPYELKAGKIYTMSMENFSAVRANSSVRESYLSRIDSPEYVYFYKNLINFNTNRLDRDETVEVVRTSMSYFTLLCSMQ